MFNELTSECEPVGGSVHPEAVFFRIFHASSNPMMVATVKGGRIIDLNEAFARFADCTREELLGKNTVQLGFWNAKQKDRRVGDGIQILDLGVPVKGGEFRYARFSVERIVLEGEPCLLSSGMESVDGRETERALKETHEKYRVLVDHSLQGLAILQDERFVFCNNRFAEMSGFSMEELLALSPEGVLGMTRETDRAFMAQRVRDRLAGKPVPPRYEYRGVRKDGTEIWVEMYASLIDFNGRPAIQAAIIDITERKRTEENLRKALDWFKAVFEGSRDAVFISDAGSRFVDMNNAACVLTGYSREDLMRMQASDLQERTNLPNLNALRERILAGEDALAEATIIRKDGSELNVEFRHSRVTICGAHYIYTVARDVTQRKRLEAQFLQSQKMEAVGALAGGVAHDFNNLLTVIKGYTELMIEDTAADDPRLSDLKQVDSAAQKATSLTSQLLLFSRKQILQPRAVNLNDVVGEMSSMLCRLIGEDIELKGVMQPDLRMVNADPGQIQQVVMNLAVNARDAMPQGGKLTIRTANVEFDESYAGEHPPARAGSYVLLAISDTGFGMDADTRAHIFEPFFTTKGCGKGTGLGLSTVYGIVKQSGGFVWVCSEPGRGAEFQIHLPASDARSCKASDEDGAPAPAKAAETVLVVEDEYAVLTLTTRILRERGYNVLAASDGAEAERRSREHAGEIHLLLTDVVMPGISGRELSTRLRKARPCLKTLYISGHADHAIVNHGVVDRNVALLQKPFAVEDLLAKVVDVLKDSFRPSLVVSAGSPQ